MKILNQFFKKKNRKKKDSLTFKISLLGVSCLLFSLTFIFRSSLLAFADNKYRELQTLVKVLNLIQQFYVDKVETKKLIHGSIKGMLAELDPHTNFLPPHLYKEFQKEAKGEFSGLGIEITLKDQIPTIISPVEETPAWKAGLKSGDQIVSIDGKEVRGLTLVETAQMIKGKKGSKVSLGIWREGFQSPKIFTITRGIIKIKSIKYVDFGQGDAYIRITSFIQNSHKELKSRIKAHKAKHKEVSGLILDVRRNPGGLFDQSVKISDLFLEEGAIVSVRGRNEKEKEVFYAKKSHVYKSFPIIVLIDEYSASASEILAGALQDHGRALIMGKRSFGKGSVQSLVDLGDKSGLKMTVAKYYTPKGKSIQAEGIVPDVEVPKLDMNILIQAQTPSKVKREENIRGHLPSTYQKKQKNSLHPTREKMMASDFQLLQAYNHLKTLKTSSRKSQKKHKKRNTKIK